MRASTLLRAAILAASFGATVAAHAIAITFVSVGGYVNGPLTSVYTESVVYQSHPGLADLSSYVETYSSATNDTAVYTSADLLNSLTISITNGVFVDGPTTYSESADWTYISGTGEWAGLTGGGTYTQNASVVDFTSTTSIKGDLSAVPEPASCAVLGLGALGLLRRRTKRA